MAPAEQLGGTCSIHQRPPSQNATPKGVGETPANREIKGKISAHSIRLAHQFKDNSEKIGGEGGENQGEKE